MSAPLCPKCKGNTAIVGVEVQGVYDGILYWLCECGHAFHRWPVGTWQHDATVAYLNPLAGRGSVEAGEA